MPMSALTTHLTRSNITVTTPTQAQHSQLQRCRIGPGLLPFQACRRGLGESVEAKQEAASNGQANRRLPSTHGRRTHANPTTTTTRHNLRTPPGGPQASHPFLDGDGGEGGTQRGHFSKTHLWPDLPTPLITIAVLIFQYTHHPHTNMLNHAGDDKTAAASAPGCRARAAAGAQLRSRSARLLSLLLPCPVRFDPHVVDCILPHVNSSSKKPSTTRCPQLSNIPRGVFPELITISIHHPRRHCPLPGHLKVLLLLLHHQHKARQTPPPPLLPQRR